MPDSTLISLLTGAGVAGVFCVLFIAGWVVPKWVVNDLKSRIKTLEAALEAANDRANVAQASQVTMRDILAALTFGQAVPHNPPAPSFPPSPYPAINQGEATQGAGE